MSRKFFMIIKMRENKEEQSQHGLNTQPLEIHHPTHFDSKFNPSALDLVYDPKFLEYLKTYGYHFNNDLADYASRLMKNYNGQQHTWNVSQVKKQLEALGLSIPSKVTAGDITYAANIAYADYYPDLLKDENFCIKYAYMSASDIDGYEGMIFSRWLADVMGKSIKIDWQKFI